MKDRRQDPEERKGFERLIRISLSYKCLDKIIEKGVSIYKEKQRLKENN